MLKTLQTELVAHAPFTALGALTGMLVLLLMVGMDLSRSSATTVFWVFHPIHVVLSALVTAGMYRLHGKGGPWATFMVGYVGSVGVATLSDSLIPFLGEWMLDLPDRGVHVGFLEKWWLVNPLAVAGTLLACFWPRTKTPHAGHVLLSTWASLFHITMALGRAVNVAEALLIFVFLFLAVWVPCCTSDIVFPLIFAAGKKRTVQKSGMMLKHSGW